MSKGQNWVNHSKFGKEAKRYAKAFVKFRKLSGDADKVPDLLVEFAKAQVSINTVPFETRNFANDVVNEIFITLGEIDRDLTKEEMDVYLAAHEVARLKQELKS